MSGMTVSALIGLINAITGLVIIYFTPAGDRKRTQTGGRQRGCSTELIPNR